MKLRTLLRDDGAVSPVIGVILMVAVTVILAAVIGTFVLGLGDAIVDTPPQASLDFDFNPEGGTGVVTITHEGGKTIQDGNYLTTTISDGSFAGTNDDWATAYDRTEVASGDSVTREISGDWTGEELRVVWDDGNEQSATLGKSTAPDDG